MEMKMDNRTLAAIGGVGLGTGIAYLLSRGRNRKGVLDRVRDTRWITRGRGEWNPTSRFLAGMTGGAMSYYGLRRRGILGNAMAAAGMGLLTRGTTNQATRNAFGIVPMVARMAGRA